MVEQIRDEFLHLKISNDLSNEKLKDILGKLNIIAVKYLKSIDELSFHQDWNSKIIAKEIEHPIPEKPKNIEEMINFLNKKLKPLFPSTGSKSFLGYIPSDPLPQSVIFASLTPFFNQFTGSVQGSPGGTAIESLVVKWITQMLGFPSSSFGSFTSGGSMANFTAIYSGLVYQLRKYDIDLKEDGLIGAKRPIIYISDETHNSIIKAILMLGLGRKSIRIVKSNRNFRITKQLVENAIQSDLKKHKENIIPIMVIATAGTTNTGSIDDIKGLRELTKEYEMWFHVDGAYGAFSKIAKHPVSQKLKDIGKADSIALDCHKWLYSPFEAGIAIVKDHSILRSAFDLTAEYLVDSELKEDIKLQRNFRSYGLPLTRELRGLKIWATIVSMGLEEIRNAITRDILKANYLSEIIRAHDKFELIHTELSIVCFKYIGTDSNSEEILSLLQNRQNYYLSTTKINNEIVLRTCFINRRSDLDLVDKLVDELNEIIANIS